MPPLTNSEKGKSDLNIISASVMCIDMLNFRDQLRALDDAGIDDVIAAKQEQLDAFLAAK